MWFPALECGWNVWLFVISRISTRSWDSTFKSRLQKDYGFHLEHSLVSSPSCLSQSLLLSLSSLSLPPSPSHHHHHHHQLPCLEHTQIHVMRNQSLSATTWMRWKLIFSVQSTAMWVRLEANSPVQAKTCYDYYCFDQWLGCNLIRGLDWEAPSQAVPRIPAPQNLRVKKSLLF